MWVGRYRGDSNGEFNLMSTPVDGCEICAMSARADRRGDALVTIACREGPEFLLRCTACGGYWLETMRFQKRLRVEQAEHLFGASFASDGWKWSARLVDAITLWDRWGLKQTLYVAEPWTADALTIVMTVLPDDTDPITRDGASFAYFLEAAIAREFLEDYVASQTAQPTPRQLAERLVRYASDDA